MLPLALYRPRSMATTTLATTAHSLGATSKSDKFAVCKKDKDQKRVEREHSRSTFDSCQGIDRCKASRFFENLCTLPPDIGYLISKDRIWCYFI
jgi:hypothetical protein